MDVSVLIPCYNRAKHIGQVVQKVLDQTHTATEIIVVDDASEDESVAVLEKLPVHLIRHKQNQGPAAARNTALQAATGDIVLYIDADAYAAPDLISVLVDAYKENNSIISLAGIGGQGIESNVTSLYDKWRLIHSPQTFGNHHKSRVPFLYGLCCSYKRNILQSIGGWDTFYRINAAEDADLGYRLRKAGYTLQYYPSATVYHQHSDTYTSLKRVQYNWFYWSYLAKRRNKLYPISLVYGTMRRMLFDTVTDIIFHHDPQLARLNLEICWVKILALRDAYHISRKESGSSVKILQ